MNMVHKIVYMNLYIKIIENKMNVLEFSEAADIGYTTLRRKLRGEFSFTLEECLAIKAALHSELPIEKLFEREKENA